MAKNFRDVEYTKVDLNSPRKDFKPVDTSVGLEDGEEDDEEVVVADRADLLPEGERAKSSDADEKPPGVLSMAYYQRFFNVDTKQVAFRVLGSFVPRPRRNLVTDEIRHSPDLYGPFWVCTTLIFTTAIAGNLADYFQTASAGKGYIWVYDFRKVTLAATVIYLYWWLMPLLLWAVVWWRQLPEKYAFLELLCLYGYSLSVYIPVSILCVIQLAFLQWIFILLGLALSGTVLALSLWPSIGSGERRTAVALLTVAMLLHALMAFGFKLYFFHMSSSSGPVEPLGTSVAASTTTHVPPAKTTTT